jgi:hypothetical protein
MMPLTQMRVRNFRAFADSGNISLGAVTPIVGRNDVGKSCLIYALHIFFNPPKKGGLSLSDLHRKDPASIAQIEVAFSPRGLRTQEVQIDAKNKIHIIDDHLVDSQGLLRLRISISSQAITAFDILIEDIDADDLFPLALKNENELLDLLKANGLKAIKAGKETNQMKRIALRRKAEQDGKGLREEWANASSVDKKLREILPHFNLFTDFANYGIDETPVQNQFKGIVDKALEVRPKSSRFTEIRSKLLNRTD